MSPRPRFRARRTSPDTDMRPSRRCSRLAILALAGVLAGIPCASTAETRLPDLGGAAGDALSRAEEDRLGEAFLRQVRRRVRLVDDPEVTDYIEALGQRIASADPDRRYRFFVVDAASVNAFAGPSGIIAVNAGLMVITQSESELAAVLAHEIAHVTQRHIAQLMERRELTSLAALASILAGIVIATQNPDAGQIAIAASAASARHSVLKFSREKEMEADRTGMALLDRAGFDPRAVPAFFERFQEWQRFTSRPPEFLSTHPVTLARIADTRGRAEQYEAKTYREGIEYLLIRTRLRVRLADDPDSAVRFFKARIDAGGANASEADRYGLVVALMHANRHREAVATADSLVQEFPNRTAHRVAAAEAYSATGDQDRALDLLASSIERFPNSRALTYGYARAFINAGRADDAMQRLRRFQRDHEPDATLFHLLGLAHQRAGRIGASHMALAEFHVHNGDLESAIRQLEIALRDPTIGDYRGARAEARRQQLLDERAGRR